jgi:uncharacterized membrane protein
VENFQLKINMNQRLWEIDTLRGVAIIGMVLYHFLFDLRYMNLIQVNLQQPIYIFFAVAVQIIFIGLAGVSIYLKKEKLSGQGKEEIFYKWLVQRSVLLGTLGLGITFVSWILEPKATIVFGILHFLATGTLISICFLSLKKLLPFFAISFILLGTFLTRMTWNFSNLLILGFRPNDWQSLDYFPMLPWLGVLLGGIYIGERIYPYGIRNFSSSFQGYKESKPAVFLQLIGKHSLLIYVLHQIVLFPFTLLLTKLF